MAVFNPVGPAAPSNVAVSAKQTLTISSVTMDAVAGNETLVQVPTGTKAFTIKVKSNGNSADKLTIATTSGNTATDDSFELFPGSEWKEDLLVGSSPINLYVASTKANTVVQLLLWS